MEVFTTQVFTSAWEAAFYPFSDANLQIDREEATARKLSSQWLQGRSRAGSVGPSGRERSSHSSSDVTAS